MGTDFSLQARVWPLLQQMLNDQQILKIKSQRLAGATVLDCGIEVPGSQEAGRLFAEICLGGLGRIHLGWMPVGEDWWPVVETRTDHPVAACLGSQHAGWMVEKGRFSATACGPARALAQREELFQRIAVADPGAEYAILCCEGREFPTLEVIESVARHCKLPHERVYLLIAPTASIVGAIQMAARSVETGLYKLLNLGYAVERVQSAKGVCCLPPAAANDLQALGRTNDAIIYGSLVWYELDDEDQALEQVLPHIPSASAADYGQFFGKLFERYGTFYNIDPNLFGPSQVCLSSPRSGRTYKAGQIRVDLLRSSFGYDG